MALTDYYVTDAGAGSGDGSSIANAMSYSRFTDYMVTGGSYTAAPGDRFNIIGAITGRTTTTDTWVNGGNSTSPVIVRGWTSGGSPAYAGRTGTNGPLDTTNFPTITYTSGRLNVTGTFIILEALNISASSLNATAVALAADCCVKSCKILNSHSGASAVALALGGRGIALDCDVEVSGATSASALNALSNGARVIGNQVKVTSTTDAIRLGTANAHALAVFNLVYTSGGAGIRVTNASAIGTILYNTVVGCTGSGVLVDSGLTSLQCVLGNMITDNGAYGVDLSAASVAAFVAYNRTRDNTSGAYNLGTDWVAATSYGDVTTDTGGPSTDYVNSGSNDYNLIAASPATSVAIPQLASMGAFQRSQTGGGSSLFSSIY